MTQQAPELDLARRLRALAPDTLEAMYDAGEQALAALESMAALGRNPVTAAIDGEAPVEEWAHYPDGDARDAGARYYYHVHSPDELGADEHGHFHIFIEPPAGEPKVAPTHVVGVAMDASGRLLRLFTTNGWVTGETWRAAAQVAASLQTFAVTSAAARRDLDAWISAIVRLFRPQIDDLLQQRDARLATMLARDPDALEDRAVRVLSESPVDLLAQLRAIEAALAVTGRA